MRNSIALTIVAVAMGLLTACNEEPQVEFVERLRPVRVALVTGAGQARQRTFSGVSQSKQRSRMSFKVNGTLVELPVQVGDELKAGQLIARLSASDYDLQIEQAEASLAQARANQRNADANYKRVKGLYENNNASRNDLDVARANAESAQAQVRSSNKSLEIAQLNRSYTRLNASAECTVASVDVELNENVNAGSPVAEINCGAGIEIRLGIPESLITGFRQDMSGSIRFNAIPGRVFTGTVTEVGIAVSGSTATYPVVVTVSDPDRAIRPGMAAEASFEFANDIARAFAIPTAAVINDERGTYTYIAEPTTDDKAVIRRQAVETGELTSRGIEIVSGLAEGDRVVTAGVGAIREKQTVLLPQD